MFTLVRFVFSFAVVTKMRRRSSQRSTYRRALTSMTWWSTPRRRSVQETWDRPSSCLTGKIWTNGLPWTVWFFEYFLIYWVSSMYPVQMVLITSFRPIRWKFWTTFPHFRYWEIMCVVILGTQGRIWNQKERPVFRSSKSIQKTWKETATAFLSGRFLSYFFHLSIFWAIKRISALRVYGLIRYRQQINGFWDIHETGDNSISHLHIGKNQKWPSFLEHRDFWKWNSKSIRWHADLPPSRYLLLSSPQCKGVFHF